MAYFTAAVVCYIGVIFQACLLYSQTVPYEDVGIKFCYDKSKTGYRLNVTEIRKVYALSVIDCILLCIHENCCRSANFRKISHFDDIAEENCQLLHAVAREGDENMVQDENYDYLLLRQPDRVFNSIEFPVESTSDYVISQGAPDMKAITVCLWTKTSKTSEVNFISYAVPENANEFILYMVRGKLGLWIGHRNTETQKVVISDGLWHSVCSTWSADEARYEIYLDGNIVLEGADFYSNVVRSKNGTWVLGQDQDKVGGGFQAYQMLVGEITEVNVWSKVLPEDQILEVSTRCKSRFRGDVKSWPDFLAGVKGGARILNDSSCCDTY